MKKKQYMLHKYREFYSLHKNRRHLLTYCKRRWSKIWYFKLCYTNTENFTVYIKTGDIYLHTAKDVEARFDTSNYELERPLPGGKNKKSYYINERWIRRKNNDSLSHWDQRYIAI